MSAELGLQLPQPFPPAGSYVPAVRTGALLYLSGADPVRADGGFVTDKVGAAVDLETGVEAARLTALQLRSVLLIEVFGDAGRGARSAVGMAELPFDISVEIELIVETAD